MSDETLPGKPPSASATELAELMMPAHSNVLGKVFGGVVLALVDKAGAAAAIRHAGRTCVTAQVDRITFHGPIEIGELIRLQAVVTWGGRTSLEVSVKVYAMNVRTGEQRRTNTCYLTMVAIDDAGKPTAVPPLLPETAAEKAAYEAAARRVAERKALRQREREDLEHC